MSRFAQRRSKLRKLIAKHHTGAMLVTDERNVTYLTGFTGDSSCLLLSAREAILISDARYTIQLEEECPDLNLVIRSPVTKIHTAAAEAVISAKISKLAVEAHNLSLANYQVIAGELAGVDCVPTVGIVEALREVKDKDELNEIRYSVMLAERAFAVVRASLRPGQTEKEIADALEHQIRLFGGRGTSFTPIVGVGDRSALPHYRPGDLRVGDAGFTLVDWGAQGRLYMSDLTRMVVTGKAPAKLEKIYNIVLAANQKAIETIRPGVMMNEVDGAARKVIEDHGYGKKFSHSLGHGIGLQIHEGPWLRSNEKQPLKAGMVVTVEPGIYLPGFGGVRIEDDVLVTRGACQVLSSVPKQWEDCHTPT
ncbi:MAG TPA: Xaa-Pro peptidase family protein [Pirellulaceae bacterium]|jgi:Xaa-Pro aminopeptidase|nr:Xaa-Pro peptidase family protein [Pirellulaceae bacterium]